MRKKTGGRTKGTPNKITKQVKKKLAKVISETIDNLVLTTPEEKLKFLQISLQYCLPRRREESISTEQPFVERPIFKEIDLDCDDDYQPQIDMSE